jgi:DNA-binding HxlR family transcriptional regulator
LRKLGSKWTLLVLRELLKEPMRFSKLQKAIPGISSKSLARTLARLEKEGLVERKVNATRPPQVAYSLVHNDPILREVIDALFRWGSR